MTKPTKIMLMALGSIFVGLGLGPLIAGGTSDLLGTSATSIAASNILIPCLIVVIFILGLLCNSLRMPKFLEWLRHPNIRRIILGSMAVACLAFFIARVDGGNTSSWRNAAHLIAGPGVNKLELREFGRQFARLSVTRSSPSIGSVGTIPVDWRVWFAGGRVDVLVRSQVTTEAANCDASQVLKVAAIGRVEVLSETDTAVRDICGRWQLVRIDLPQGVTELQFNLDRSDSIAEATIDIMLAANRPYFAWFWMLCTVAAVGLIVTIVCLLSENLRSGDHSAKTGTGLIEVATRKRGLITGGAVLIFILLSNVFMYWYVSQEETIYTWDYSGYWTSSRNVSDFLRGNERKSAGPPSNASEVSDSGPISNEPEQTMPDPGAIAALIRSIRFAEYNVAFSVPVAPVMAVFGGSRMVYELSLLNTYALASLILLIVAVRSSGGNDVTRWPNWWPILPVVIVMCFVPFWVPILRGYVGVSVAVTNLAVLWLYFRQPVREISTMSLSVIGVFLLAGVILQRWNAYWVVGFFVMACADGVWELIRNRRFNAVEIFRSMRAPIVSGFVAFFLFAVIAWPKVVRIVTTDYADIYSAFQEDDGLISALLRQVDAFGAGIFALILVSFIFLTVRAPTRRVALLLGIQLLYVFLHFSSTQTMGPHQYFLLLPGLLVILSLGLASAISSNIRPIAISGASAAALVLVFGMASGNAVFVPSDDSAYLSRSRLLSQSYRPPLVSNDLDEFKRLAQYVDELMADAPEKQGIYVLSGSATLNAVHFKTITASTGTPFNSAARVLGSSVVDKRDGFPRGILRAHIVISSDPIQLMSRRPSDQQVIQVPADRMFKRTGIGAAFERLPVTFRLDGEVDAVVFRRFRPSTVEEIADLSEGLRKFYPDRPNVYQ